MRMMFLFLSSRGAESGLVSVWGGCWWVGESETCVVWLWSFPLNNRCLHSSGFFLSGVKPEKESERVRVKVLF